MSINPTQLREMGLEKTAEFWKWRDKCEHIGDNDPDIKAARLAIDELLARIEELSEMVLADEEALRMAGAAFDAEVNRADEAEAALASERKSWDLAYAKTLELQAKLAAVEAQVEDYRSVLHHIAANEEALPHEVFSIWAQNCAMDALARWTDRKEAQP